MNIDQEYAQALEIQRFYDKRLLSDLLKDDGAPQWAIDMLISQVTERE